MKEKSSKIGRLDSNDQDGNRKRNLDRKLSPGITCFPLSAPAVPPLLRGTFGRIRADDDRPPSFVHKKHAPSWFSETVKSDLTINASPAYLF